jgi:predicted transposase
MKLTLQIQLLPDKESAAKLKSTIERFNEACSWLAKQAFESKTANKITLQQKFYYDLREKFDLSAQMAAICIRHVGGTYSRDKSILPVFRPCAAMPYDNRIMSFKGIDRVSLLTLEGRVIVPFVMGNYQRERFSLAKIDFIAEKFCTTRATAQSEIEVNGFPIRAADVCVAFDHRFF